MRFLLLHLFFCLNIFSFFSQTNIDSCLSNWSGIAYDVPEVFQNMRSTVAADTFYIAINDSLASDLNNGKYSTYIGGNNGPWKSFGGLGVIQNTPDSITAGDMLMLRNGNYIIDSSINISFYGSEQLPVYIKNYPGETPIIEGSFDLNWYDSLVQLNDTNTLINYYSSWNNTPMVLFSGEYTIVEGITFINSHLSCIVNNGRFCIIQNCKLIGSMEDLIKSTYKSYYNLIYNNEFTQFGGEAIDVFGANNYYVVNNTFHHQYPGINPRSNVTVAWAKGGADSVFFINNRMENLEVYSNALVLGGCCWNNRNNTLDSLGNLNPVSTNVFAYGNLFNSIVMDSSSIGNSSGILSFQASRYTQASDNVFFESSPVMSIIKASHGTGQTFTADNATFSSNYVANQNGFKLYNLSASYDPLSTYIDSNCIFTNQTVTCHLGGVGSLNYPSFISIYSFDINGCQSNYDALCDSISFLELENFKGIQKEIILYPNPTSDIITIKGLNSLSNVSYIHLLDNKGALVEKVSSNESQIDLSSFSTGIYFIEIKHRDGIGRIKVIKQ